MSVIITIITAINVGILTGYVTRDPVIAIHAGVIVTLIMASIIAIIEDGKEES